jgi:hypothetical protein
MEYEQARSLGMEFVRESMGKNGEQLGKALLYINDKVVAQGPMKTQVGKFTLSGDGLCIGYDSGDAVSSEYKTSGTFAGGKIQFVGIYLGRKGPISRPSKGSGTSPEKRLMRIG